jgi:hypothetical protein
MKYTFEIIAIFISSISCSGPPAVSRSRWQLHILQGQGEKEELLIVQNIAD